MMGVEAMETLSGTVILSIMATLLAALILGGGTGILEKVDGTPLGGSVQRGATAFAVVISLVAAHMAVDASALVCLVNALFGVTCGLAGVILARIDTKPWPRAVIGGGACFGGAAGVMVALEVMARVF
ncbi:hypothetical protein [Actinoplanes sp. NBRC 103695]|uniref:hypothetical protein n=1 Tax=Actinoplanes sp. NBRC 103695 TaxID=3032202 RepID=UPI0025570029|nr:hypothetical protein [Actinoplanes sp. NBRC 103695]